MSTPALSPVRSKPSAASSLRSSCLAAGLRKEDVMNAAQLFVKALEDEGVEVIYAVPGEQKRGVNAFWNQFCVLLEPGPRFSE